MSGPVRVEASMSLDGVLARPDDTVGPLFDWYGNGPDETPTAMPGTVFRTGRASATHLRAMLASTGAVVVGRRQYEVAHGWGGHHPIGAPVVVVTHEPPADPPEGATPLVFVDGVEAAVGRACELAGDRAVAVAAGDVGSQALAADLVDEVHVDLVPVVLGSGRPFFTPGLAERLLDGPRVIEGDRVTHLVYAVRRGSRG